MKSPSRFILALAALVLSPVFAEEQEALKFVLPKAYYGGTVISYWSPRLETTLYPERKPLLAPKGTTVVSTGKPVTARTTPTVGELKQINDGNKEFGKTSLVELPEGTQWVQIDLEATHAIHAILLWHFHEGARVYFDVIGQISDDPEFKTGVTSFYNNDFDNSSGLGQGEDKEYIDISDGRLFELKGKSGRYVRFLSRGNTANDFNNYVEIEVWGKKANGE